MRLHRRENHLFGRAHATKGMARFGAKRRAPATFGKGERRIVRRDNAKDVTIPDVDVSKFGIADPRGTLQYGRKYRLKIARRTANDPEHF